MEPFTSNDTYACPDCGSEVRVGARSCPGCGPFQPVEWEDNANDDDLLEEPASPFHSSTTYTDTREVLEQSRYPLTNALPPAPASLKPPNFPRVFLLILVGLTLLSATMAALKIFFAR